MSPLARHLGVVRGAAAELLADADRFERQAAAIVQQVPGAEDTLPPSSASQPTLPVPPPSYGAIPPIPRGQAQQILSAALDDHVRTYQYLEAVSMALARALDAQEETTTT